MSNWLFPDKWPSTISSGVLRNDSIDELYQARSEDVNDGVEGGSSLISVELAEDILQESVEPSKSKASGFFEVQARSLSDPSVCSDKGHNDDLPVLDGAGTTSVYWRRTELEPSSWELPLVAQDAAAARLSSEQHLEILIAGKRLRDISDLPLDLAI